MNEIVSFIKIVQFDNSNFIEFKEKILWDVFVLINTTLCQHLSTPGLLLVDPPVEEHHHMHVLFDKNTFV